MAKYQKGKIYAIRSYQTDKIYIGSTCDTLSRRLSGHRMQFKNFKNGKSRFVTSFELLKYADYYIELLELYPCDSKIELHKREGELIRSNECVNKVIPGRTQKEYQELNKDKISKNQKEYYNNNKDKISKHKSTKIKCCCGSEITRRHLARHQKTEKHFNNTTYNFFHN